MWDAKCLKSLIIFLCETLFLLKKPIPFLTLSFWKEKSGFSVTHQFSFIQLYLPGGGGVLMLLFTNLSDKSNMNYRDEEGNPQIKTVHPAAHAVLGPSFSLPVSYLTYF